MDLSEHIDQIQLAIRKNHFEGWLLYDFRGTNPLARTVLKMGQRPAGSRRWFYYIPAEGTPVRLVHAIEAEALDHLPGEKIVYRSWRSLHESLQRALPEKGKVAMEYSPLANNPYVSRVDAGTVELVRSFGIEIVSSGNLIQVFDACLNPEQWQQHLLADQVTNSAYDVAWDYIAKQVRQHGSVSEQDVCQQILDHFATHGMYTYSPPTVARQPNNRLPHYETGTGDDTAIRSGDLVLIDLWCKSRHAQGIYSDLTKMAYVGQNMPAEFGRVFQIVAQARDAGIEFVENCCRSQRSPAGWEVDHVVRDIIEQAGFGSDFLHRTGHNLGAEVHGNGTHLDDLEMHEERLLLPGSLFTIEPGIYLEHFGIRSEVNLFIDHDYQLHVTGQPIQTEIQQILI